VFDTKDDETGTHRVIIFNAEAEKCNPLFPKKGEMVIHTGASYKSENVVRTRHFRTGERIKGSLGSRLMSNGTEPEECSILE